MSDSAMSDLLGYLHRLWSSTPGYREPFTKSWWSAQQSIAENIEIVPLQHRDALVRSWEFATNYVRNTAGIRCTKQGPKSE